MVHEADAGEVGLNRELELLIIVRLKPGQLWIFWDFMDGSTDLRNVVEIVGFNFRQDERIQWIGFEPFLRNVEGHVRSVETDGKEEGFYVVFGELFLSPRGHLEVGHHVVALGEGAPVSLSTCPWHVG